MMDLMLVLDGLVYSNLTDECTCRRESLEPLKIAFIHAKQTKYITFFVCSSECILYIALFMQITQSDCLINNIPGIIPALKK